MTTRIGIVCEYYPPHVGGIATQVESVATEMARRMVDVHIVTRNWPGPVTASSVAGLTIHRIAAGSKRAVFASTFVTQAARLLSASGVDIIHAHELFLPATAALVAKQVTGVPTVVSIHSSGPDLGEIARLRRARLGQQRLAYLRNNVDAFVAVSRVVAEEMAAVGIATSKRHVIPNGVDSQRFHPARAADRARLRKELDLPAGELGIYTGRLSSEKRLLELAHLWPAVRKQHPNAALVLVGDGPVRSALTTLHSPGVFLVGEQRDIVPYLQAADFFVLPSVSEGFSISTLEAMACGLPVVATRVGAIPELIQEGETGFIVPPDDWVAMANAINVQIAALNWGPAMSKAARERVVPLYSIEKVTECTLALYEQVRSMAGKRVAAHA
jgi:glycosyltransferase involved in cell wall biosynthesis